jgi:bifunctional ADP-heptose synthase (sugar kinase/adenylyltransferase)
VLADLVADEFVFGEISRVSREAPVLILNTATARWFRAAAPMPSTTWPTSE